MTGVMFADGYGIERNEKEAVYWYRQAANQGNPLAQTNLGIMYSEGRGTPKDIHRAIVNFRAAAKQGDSLAQLQLGFIYRSGTEVPDDYLESARWHLLAAAQGNALATFELAILFLAGTGVPKNPVIAKALFVAASIRDPENSLGVPESEELSRSLTAGQVMQASGIARLLSSKSGFERAR